MSSSACFDFFETEIRCENGIFNVYRRPINIIETDWILTQSGCCSNSGVIVGCCPNDFIPTTLFATFSSATGTCTCMEGLRIQLTWNGSQWLGQEDTCPLEVILECLTETWFITLGSGVVGCSVTFSPPASTCNPFSLIFTNMTIGNCCSGNVTVEINLS